MKQNFKITLRLNVEVENGSGFTFTEARVKKQVEKFLKDRYITEGLPCCGKGEFIVTDVFEDKQQAALGTFQKGHPLAKVSNRKST